MDGVDMKKKSNWFECCRCHKRIYNQLSFHIYCASGYEMSPLCQKCYDNRFDSDFEK